MKKGFLICILILILPQITYAQNDDFGIWYEINTGYRIKKKLDLKLSSEVRTFNSASRVDQAFIEGGLSYKLNDYLSIAGSYRPIIKLEDDSEYHFRHKWFTEIKGSFRVKDFTFSSRLIVQFAKRTFFEDKDDESLDFHGRIRLKATYNTPGFPVNPYLSFETFSPLFANSDKIVDKERFSAGFEYKISKKHAMKSGYLLERDLKPDLSVSHIILISYEFSF